MPTREDLLNPDYRPTTFTLRWLEVDRSDPFRPNTSPQSNNRVLQVFCSRTGRWEDVPVVTQAELDERFLP